MQSKVENVQVYLQRPTGPYFILIQLAGRAGSTESYGETIRSGGDGGSKSLERIWLRNPQWYMLTGKAMMMILSDYYWTFIRLTTLKVSKNSYEIMFWKMKQLMVAPGDRGLPPPSVLVCVVWYVEIKIPIALSTKVIMFDVIWPPGLGPLTYSSDWRCLSHCLCVAESRHLNVFLKKEKGFFPLTLLFFFFFFIHHSLVFMSSCLPLSQGQTLYQYRVTTMPWHSLTRKLYET